jgi:hypothetical protein
MPEDRIAFVEKECGAVEEALRRANRGDLVLVFCDSYALCWEKITSYQLDPWQTAVASPLTLRDPDMSELDEGAESELLAEPREEAAR